MPRGVLAAELDVVINARVPDQLNHGGPGNVYARRNCRLAFVE